MEFGNFARAEFPPRKKGRYETGPMKFWERMPERHVLIWNCRSFVASVQNCIAVDSFAPINQISEITPNKSCSSASSTSHRQHAGAQLRTNVPDVDFAVDFGRIGLGTAGGADVAVLIRFAHFVDYHRESAADLGGELGRADRLGFRHQPGVALFLDLFGHRAGQIIGRGARHRLEAERADAVELGFVEPVEQVLEISLGLAGKADDEAGADRDVGADRAPVRQPFEHPRLVGRALHRLEHAGRWHAGTGCRDRASAAPRPSAGSPHRRADRDRHSAAAPTASGPRACAAGPARGRDRSCARVPGGPCHSRGS